MLVHEFKPTLRNSIPIGTLSECLKTVVIERVAIIGGSVGCNLLTIVELVSQAS